MKNLIHKLVAAFILAFAVGAPAMASTTCTSTVSWVQSDAGSGSGTLSVVLASGAWFSIPATDAMFKSVAGGAYLALTTGATVSAVFSASGLTCSSAYARTDLVGFINNAS